MRYLLIICIVLLVSGCANLMPVELPASAVKTEHGTLITLEDILFEYDEAILRPAGWELVSTIGHYVTQNPGITVRVEGHTDNVGSTEYNMQLSKRRAETVRNVLRARGVESSRISVENYGESKPIADNETEEGRRQNRRVEVTLSKPKSDTYADTYAE
jgi:outer membrane protein OmpA-like peptidoglycan-associated protein